MTVKTNKKDLFFLQKGQNYKYLFYFFLPSYSLEVGGKEISEDEFAELFPVKVLDMTLPKEKQLAESKQLYK